MTKDELAKFLFARPEHEEWFYDEDVSLPKPPAQLLPVIAEVLREVPSMAGTFSERQLCMGLRYLIDPGCSDVCFAFIHGPTPIDIRTGAIRAMMVVFEGLFASRCVQRVPFNELADVQRFSFEETCYMWWDLFPRHGVPTSQDLRAVDLTILEILREGLDLNNLACVESALRGLGFWAASYSEEVTSIIDNATSIPAPLAAFASEARAGQVR